jgi:signal peptidase II
VFPSVFFAVLLADQITKFLALRYLHESGTIAVIPSVFHLTLVYNTGIAFGVFREHPTLLLILITCSLVFLFFWGWHKPDLTPAQRLSMALILSGALGNWIDRVRFGAVIDFLDFRIWPVFNVADSAITIGVTLFAAVSLFRKPQ